MRLAHLWFLLKNSFWEVYISPQYPHCLKEDLSTSLEVDGAEVAGGGGGGVGDLEGEAGLGASAGETGRRGGGDELRLRLLGGVRRGERDRDLRPASRRLSWSSR